MARAPKLMDDLMEALAAPHAPDAPEAGGPRTWQRAVVNKLVEQAAKGEARAAQLLITLKREADAEAQETPATGDLAAEDRAILADYNAQVRGGTGAAR